MGLLCIFTLKIYFIFTQLLNILSSEPLLLFICFIQLFFHTLDLFIEFINRWTFTYFSSFYALSKLYDLKL